MDNPFARFGVEHLSATSMNQFRADPALGILYLVYNIREQGSPAMHRGSAVDETIGALLSDEDSMNQSSACDLATRTYDALISKTDEVYAQHAIAKERDVVIACMQRCYPIMSDWDKPLSYQQPINLSLQDIEVPVIGYIDLRYPGEVRELKTSGKRRRSIIDDHAFQVSTYAMAIRQESGAWPSAVLDYICPTGMESFQLQNGNKWVKKVVDTANSIRWLLATASTEAELCQLIQPDFSKPLWRYRPNSRAAAKSLFEC